MALLASQCCRLCGLFSSITPTQNLSHCCLHRVLVRSCSSMSKYCKTVRIGLKSTRTPACSNITWNGNTDNFGTITLARLKNSLSAGKETSLQTVKSIENYLKQKDIMFHHGHTTIIAQCPFCEVAPNRKNNVSGYAGESLTLFVNKTTGSHVCNSCGTSGTWSQFKFWMSEKKPSNKTGESPTATMMESERERVGHLWDKAKPFGECKESLKRYISKRVDIQPLLSETLKLYKVHTILHKFSAPDGSQRQHLCLAFPWYDYEKQRISGIKLHKVKMKEDESHNTIEPRHGSPGLFGWHTVTSDAKEVVLTADEFDAMAVHQATSFPALSLPLGLSSLPPEVLPHLEQFEKIILWFGNDVRSRQAANKFARKLNIQRCHFVRMDTSGPTSALDALRKGQNLNSILGAAQAASHKQIVTFQQVRDDVYNELCNVDQVAGIKWTRFSKLTEILKGHRRGELTVFTGPTGAGKTTLLSELSVDLCMQGVNTLWGSFEVRNVRLVKTMLNQFSGLNLEKNLQQYSYWAEKFEMLPMYFMSFYGAQNLQDVLSTMSHAAYVHDIEHVIVDNLQFMISNSYSPDRFYAQNMAISEFRKFATAKNVHVTLVIHPRKESDDAELQTASIFGSAKASQEADNVIILQDKKGKTGKYLQVTKNRFDGTLGKIYLDFNRESLTMSPYQPNSGNIAPAKKESKHLRSVKPPKPGTTSKKSKNDAEEQVKTASVPYGGATKSFDINNKQRAHGTIRDKRVTGGSSVASEVTKDDARKTNSSSTDAAPSNEAAKKRLENSQGTSLSSKATRFDYDNSSRRAVLTGKKISVKQLDVDNAYLQ